MAFGKFRYQPPQMPAEDASLAQRMAATSFTSSVFRPPSGPHARCSSTGCPAIITSNSKHHGMCRKHYDRMWRAKHSTPDEHSGRCHVTGCPRLVYYKAKMRRMCRSHYDEMRKLKSSRMAHLASHGMSYDMETSTSMSSTMSDESSSASGYGSSHGSPSSTDDIASELPDESFCLEDVYMDRPLTDS